MFYDGFLSYSDQVLAETNMCSFTREINIMY